MNNIIWQKKSHKKETWILWYIKSIPIIQQIIHSKEIGLVIFFFLLFGILLARLVRLQIIKHNQYEIQLSKLYYKESLLSPDRWNIYALDKWWHTVQLTENITLYDLALDPQDLTEFPQENASKWLPTGAMKPRFIEIIAPIIYKHLCEINWMHTPTKAECVRNVELFAGVEILPKKPDLFYFGRQEDWTPIRSESYNSFDFTGYNEIYNKIVDEFTEARAMELINTRLNEKIQIGVKTSNYLGYFTEPKFLEELKQLNFPFISIEKENYIYVVPARVENKSRAISQLKTLLNKRRYPIWENFDKLFEVQQRRYIKLISWLNPALADEVRDLKVKHQNEKSKKDPANDRYIGIPVLYGLILEPYTTRYYPYENFMANILGYVDKNGVAYYGIEQYFDDILKWKKWEIKWRSSWSAWNVWTNDFEIQQPIDWSDIYLTIDVWLQREAESLAAEHLNTYRADAISILVLDTQNWEVKASVSAPSFNPNNYNDAYTLIPLWEEYAYIIDDQTYVDIPVYIFTGNSYKVATYAERTNTWLQKYINSNIFGTQVFVDNNISTPFEPGSIFKSFTTAIWLDTDEVSLQDIYKDEWQVKVWIYTIKNASKICEWENNFLHALIWSCNVWMVNIVQKIKKYAFYNYLSKLGFWQLTNIELAWEKEGFIDDVNIVSVARFLNNSFWQWLTTTQIQLAAAYAALVNWWYYIKPTIISHIIDKNPNQNEELQQETDSLRNRKKIFKDSTSETIKQWLWEVLNHNTELASANIEQVKLWAKSWTAQISFRWKYQRWNWWTNGTFAGVISIDDPRYVVLIWIRRPRSNQWWWLTAWPIFKEIASYILAYDI